VSDYETRNYQSPKQYQMSEEANQTKSSSVYMTVSFCLHCGDSANCEFFTSSLLSLW